LTAKEHFEAGRLSAAIESLNGEIRSAPADLKLRSFLFELLCFAGQYDRAERQLDVVAQSGATAELAVDVYRRNIAAERKRAAFFSDDSLPTFLLEPPPYVALQIQAVHQLREKQFAPVEELLSQANTARPVRSGQLDGVAFSSLRDSDDLLAPILEVFAGDRYVWLPFDQITRVEISEPKKLRDLLWIHAAIVASDGSKGDVFLPALYPGSVRHSNEQVRLGRATEWEESGGVLSRGFGQRVFIVDDHDKGLLEIRRMEFST
jgi:type VI secretion system protein ImpE